MTPLQLDYIINGAKVFIYKRQDGIVYASLDDFSRFGAVPLETVRVPLTEKSTTESVRADPSVLERVSALTSALREGE